MSAPPEKTLPKGTPPHNPSKNLYLYLGLLMSTAMKSRSLSRHQRLPAQERTGPARTDCQVPPAPRNGTSRVQRRAQRGRQRKRPLGGLNQHQRRVELLKDPIQHGHPRMAAAVDEQIPDRGPDELVEELRSGIQHPREREHPVTSPGCLRPANTS
jgi:hypothetical protein